MIQLHHGDCLDVLRTMPDASVDAIVTDPPYGLRFMGEKWDYDVPTTEVWAECLRVLKPGGHLLAFAGTRTQHRMAVRIEDAGFEIRDMIAWVYGCLDEATEVAAEFGVMPYHKTKAGDRVLCYDAAHGEYSYQPILEIVEYDYSDTAYRLVGDFGEQVVSRNHRVIVERGGSEAFQLAETLECEARVPVLESLSALRQALHDAHQGAGRPQQDVQCGMCECADRCSECRDDAAGTTQGRDDQVRGLRGKRLEARCVAAQGGDANMQQEVQRRTARCGVGEACTHWEGALVARVGGGAEEAHDGRVQPGLEGRADVSQPEGRLRGSADQVRAMPCGPDEHGAGGRLCDGAPSCGGSGSGATAEAGGVRASHQPRCDGQPAREPDAVRHECTAQGIRAWGGHRSAVVRVVPFHYTGKVWCLRVPTGAFVAVRNGVAFPTGNSGFPKSLNVSISLDKKSGAMKHRGKRASFAGNIAQGQNVEPAKSMPAHQGITDAARQWQGWGTALKPALEPITVARKPLEGTVAANVLRWGTGGINVDGCRVACDPADLGDPARFQVARKGADSWDRQSKGMFDAGRAGGWANGAPPGRWPANLIHDGSDEVVGLFPGAGKESAARFFYTAKTSKADRDEGCEELEYRTAGEMVDRKDGSAGMQSPRAGAGRTGGGRNKHPTVKPVDLMRYLCRLVTPPGGIVLDPFMGSGSTGKACVMEGFSFIGIERDADSFATAQARVVAPMPLFKEML